MLIRKYPILLSFFLLPTLFVILYFQNRFEKIANFKAEVQELQEKQIDLKQKFTAHLKLFDQIKTTSPLYFQKELSSLSFLDKEVRKMQIVLDHYKESASLQNRLNFLKSGKNRISLKEEKNSKTDEFEESIYSLAFPVQMDVEDLRALFSFIQNIKNPHLFFEQFTLKKKEATSQEEVFEIDFKLIKREAL